jgi:ABC-type multidrug transport system ATPase subunit
MESLGFPSNWIMRPIIILLAFVFVFYIGAGLILQYWKVEMGFSQAQKTDNDASAGKEKMRVRSLEEVRTVHVSLHNYSLDVENRKSVREKSQISILKPVTANFEPGVLNVIMGPSGSGKTSLLNLMACRLHSSMTAKYQTHGEMLFNGAVPSERVIRSICGYVSQDDDSLLPYLTVRENLHFAAGLRLPIHLSKEEKVQRAEAILLKMGLRDCADNLVGSALVKGISGGEKRRVTISIQILTEPRVLLLDEPTSGLDAFTASSIVDVLRGLAVEGRTLVLTIHQSRSDLFKHFGNILLLARGGHPVFAGKGSQMLPHFAALGYECPVATNPADFALDLITINLQGSTNEATSREKVQSLISSWSNASPRICRTSSHIATPAELGSLARAVTPFHIAFPLLLRRSFINFRRNPPSVIARTTQVLGFCIILTLFFAPLKSDYYSVQTRLGFIQEFAALYFVGMLQNVAVYPDEKQVFYSEHDDNAYSVEAFFVQYTMAEIPFEVFTSLLFSLLTVLAAGLPRSATLFFITSFNIFSVVSCGESVGIIFNTLVSHTGFAVSLTSIVLSIATVMGGVMSLNIPPFLQAFNHLSPIKWSVGSLAAYSLRGVKFSCTEFQRLENGKCPIETGEDVLRLYGLDGNPRLNVLALGLCMVVYRGLGYLVLKARTARWSWRGKG